MILEKSVMDYLHKLPEVLSEKTYKDKAVKGRHCTLASLHKYSKEVFTKVYKIPFEKLPPKYQREIERTVEDTYWGLKEARQYE